MGRQRGRPKTTPRPWGDKVLDASGLYRMQTKANCRECGKSPAKVRLGHYSLCGVCWNKIQWLRWAMKELKG